MNFIDATLDRDPINLVVTLGPKNAATRAAAKRPRD